MSRPIKTGLDYFPLDVHLDEKIEILEAKHGIIAFAVIVKLFQRIYSNGYFCNWGDTETLLFAKRNNVDVNVAITIVNDAITHKLFDKTLFENYGILTSTGIQKRFFEIKKRSNVEIDSQYLLIKTSEKQCKNTETKVNVAETQVNVAETQVNTESSTQSKVKESKVKKKDINKLISKKEKVESPLVDFIDGYDFEYTRLSKDEHYQLVGEYDADLVKSKIIDVEQWFGTPKGLKEVDKRQSKSDILRVRNFIQNEIKDKNKSKEMIEFKHNLNKNNNQNQNQISVLSLEDQKQIESAILADQKQIYQEVGARHE